MAARSRPTGTGFSSLLLFVLSLLTLTTSSLQLNRVGLAAKSTALDRRLVYPQIPGDSILDLVVPWPDFAHADMGWYRQGLREVDANAELIQALGDDRVPSILLAAAVANQGNSVQRLFGVQLGERLQLGLGVWFDWPFPRWQWAARLWQEVVEQPSVGVSQLLPEEARRLRGFGRPDLFDDQTSIRLMYLKLADVYAASEPIDLDVTHRFVLQAIGNNVGPGAVAAFSRHRYNLARFLSRDRPARMQLAKIMTYVEYLADQEDWQLPEGVDRAYIWSLVNEEPERSTNRTVVSRHETKHP